MSKYWEEVRKNHHTLKANIGMKEYELCDLYLYPNKIHKCYIGECICNSDNINPIFDMFSSYDLEAAKAQAEVFVIKQLNKKKDKLESEIYRYNKMLDELK